MVEPVQKKRERENREEVYRKEEREVVYIIIVGKDRKNTLHFLQMYD